jgi:hypothetical protein
VTETEKQARRAKALDAVRDVLKQVITIEAALLTFGIAFVQNITKSRGPTGLIVGAVIALLVGIFFGILGLVAVVEQTNSETGSINGFWLRALILAGEASFVLAIVFIGLYVIETPIHPSH